jgi:ParB family chromosome partitioning protein
LKQGRNVPDIAKTFGLTDRYVKQRLALANLQGAIKDAYRNGDIEAEELQLLATATRPAEGLDRSLPGRKRPRQ